MLDILTIRALYLPSEITQPKDDSEKFVNSDKPWQDVSLGKNAKAAKTAFAAIQIATQDDAELVSESNS